MIPINNQLEKDLFRDDNIFHPHHHLHMIRNDNRPYRILLLFRLRPNHHFKPRILLSIHTHIEDYLYMEWAHGNSIVELE